VIINTGSFLPLSGRSAVDIEGHTLAVRPIVRERGVFTVGAPETRFDVTPLQAGEGA
jgi:hypothetical protein